MYEGPYALAEGAERLQQEQEKSRQNENYVHNVPVVSERSLYSFHEELTRAVLEQGDLS